MCFLAFENTQQLHLTYLIFFSLQFSFNHFECITSTTTICLQIGDKGSILFNTPPQNQKLRINLPEWSKGLPLRAEAVDFTDPFYRNGDNLKDERWPCRLKGSNIPNVRQRKIGTNSIDKSQLKKTPSTKRSIDLKQTQAKLISHKLKIHRNLKTVNRIKPSVE